MYEIYATPAAQNHMPSVVDTARHLKEAHAKAREWATDDIIVDIRDRSGHTVHTYAGPSAKK